MSFSPAALLGILAACAIGTIPAAHAGYEVLATFERPGVHPLAALVMGSDGNFYGTTVAGGASSGGTIFRLTPSGVRTTLVSFTGTGGAAPGAAPEVSLVRGPDLALWGTTTSGGTAGFGTVFRLTEAGVFTSVISFSGDTGPAHGSVPQGLCSHPDGFLYGSTLAGGAAGAGTLFRLSPAGILTTLVEFSGASGATKGAEPVSDLTVSGSNLYGVTRSGGTSGMGTIFRVTTGGAFTLLTEFTGMAGSRPGANPAGGLFLNTDGALYGTTELGGTHDFGTAFRLTDVASPVFTPLHSFLDAEGSQPTGTLTKGSDAALYGVCAGGGTGGAGVIYRITTTGTRSVLTNFSGWTGAAPGAAPRGGLTVAGDGTLWGNTSAGGPGNAGVAFRITTAGNYTSMGVFTTPQGYGPAGAPVAEQEGSLLLPMTAGGNGGSGTLLRWNPTDNDFTTAADLGGLLGTGPSGGLLRAGNLFFGLTASGGSLSRGTAYQYSAAAGISTLAAFNAGAGSASEGPLITGSDGAYYGVSREGGSAGHGTLFRLSNTGVRTRLVSFTGLGGAAPGADPRGPLVLAANGSFYGVTSRGGTADAGTLFRLSAAGVLTTLAHFTATGPRQPSGGLTPGPGGFFYGPTALGGAGNAGTLLRLDPATGLWESLAAFDPTLTGNGPRGSMVPGPDGALYGMTSAGGLQDEGTIFRYSAGSGLQTLLSFTGSGGPAAGSGLGTDDTASASGGLLVQPDGTLVGLTPGGGSGGGGVAFRLSTATPLMNWKQQMLGDAAAPDLDDPDKDGVATLIEYGLGRHPGVPEAAPLPESSMAPLPGGPFLTLTLPRDPSHPDIILTVEAASHLSGPWLDIASSTYGSPFSGPGYASGDSASSGIKTILIRDTVPAPAAASRFLRLRVSR